MELRGDRVVLRALTPADVARLVEIGREPEFARWWPDHGRDDLLALAHGSSDEVAFAVTVEGQVIGVAQFSEELDPQYRHAGIDVGIATAWQNQGLGTDTVRTLARYLIRERGHHRVVIDPAADNHRAIRCYEKVGFRPVGVMRGYERGGDGSFHDGLLLDLLAADVT